MDPSSARIWPRMIHFRREVHEFGNSVRRTSCRTWALRRAKILRRIMSRAKGATYRGNVWRAGVDPAAYHSHHHLSFMVFATGLSLFSSSLRRKKSNRQKKLHSSRDMRTAALFAVFLLCAVFTCRWLASILTGSKQKRNAPVVVSDKGTICFKISFCHEINC